jgi:tetratricopeptide (TPR) repeat protein
MAEGPAREERSKAAAAAGGADTAAAALAMSGASREEADAFLRKQSTVADKQALLLDLEIADLQREDSLRHWSLRIRHISDVMKLGFEFSVAFVVVVLVVGLGSALWNAAHDNGLIIETFSVPPDMTAKGVTGEVVASKILDRLSAMQSETDSTRAASSYTNNWDKDIKVQVPDTGVSLGEIDTYLHEWLGHQMHIKGEVYRTASGIAVTAGASGIASTTVTGGEQDLDTLIDKTADAIYRGTQPYRYALYVRTAPAFRTNPKQFGYANEDLEELVRTGTVEDRAWSYDAIGEGFVFRGDFYDAVTMLRRAIATKPTLDAYTDLADTEYLLQHDEGVLETRREADAFATGGEEADMNASDAASDALFDKQDLALTLGDNLAVLEYGRRMVSSSHREHTLDLAYEDDLQACGASHDFDCLRRVRNAPPPPLRFLDALTARERLRLADVLLGHFEDAVDEAPAVATIPSISAGVVSEIARRMGNPLSALIRANLGDRGGAHALIDKTPLDCATCVRFRGRIDALERNWGGARYWFERAVAQSPSVPFAYADWGQMLFAKGDYNGAIAKFKAANQKGPHFADPLEMWGDALIRQNRSDLALAKFTEANRYAPNWGRLHLKWGEALLWTGDKTGAAKQFAIASGLDLSASDISELARVKASHG